MISNVAYDTQAHELALLLEIFHDEAARLTQEQWQMDFFSEEDAFAAFIKDDPLVDMACMEAAGDEGVALIERFREKYADAFLMVIADASVSPVKYIKPSIMPGSLLLRPAGAVHIRAVVGEFIRAYLQKTGRGLEENVFVVESREGRVRVPYGQISYFEAREKKIFVRAGRREFGFYDTMDHLCEVLPDEFIRCHRSFIINRNKIEKVVLSQSTVFMEEGLMVPISRSYRTRMRQA